MNGNQKQIERPKMSGFFFELPQGNYGTTIKNMKIANSFFKKNPTSEIPTGMWSHAYFNKAQYERWFLEQLHAKINRNVKETGRKFTDEYQSDLKCDARIINEYFGRRIRNSGCLNILRTPEMKKQYPFINSQERID